MKGTIAQYVTLGIMLVIIVLIVSFLPAQHVNKLTDKQVVPAKVTNLSARNNAEKVRAD